MRIAAALYGGSIPACAGEPATRPTAYPCRGVYPRVCGGTRRLVSTLPCPCGLSPRVRGNLINIYNNTIGKRSIPACAGEPYGGYPRSGCRRVYPRVCGGTPSASEFRGHSRGLSPRVRGNRPRQRAQLGPGRSIPACAGEPRRPPKPTPHGEVYPRVCGGTGSRPLAGSLYMGLSPRVRGNLSLSVCGTI